MSAAQAVLAARFDDDGGNHSAVCRWPRDPTRIVQFPTVRIAIGADHAGFPLKEHLKGFLETEGHEVLDFGTDSEAPVDYPAFCAAAARAVAAGEADRGIVMGGSGQGEQIVANKIRGIRAALCHDLYVARLSRAHNDANVLGLGARVIAPELAEEIVKVWLATPFDGGRHERRIEQIASIEREDT
jgi:ribose 5-phosphate isomerase B